MKKLLAISIFIIMSWTLVAQTDGISYQAVIINPNVNELPGNDATGNILPNSNVGLQFTIVDAAEGIVYQETQTTTTDAFGMINVFIGQGNPLEGSFTEIDWDGTSKDLKVAIDFNGAGSYEPLSDQALTFVPFAYHRNITATGNMTIDGESVFNGESIFNQNVSVLGNTTLNQNVEVTGNATIDGDSFLNGNVAVGQTLRVEGTTALNNTLNVNNQSATALSGSLTAEGTTVLNGELQVNNIATFTNNLVVTENNTTQLGGSLTVDGITTLNNDFIINGETIMNNGLAVNGDTQLNGRLEVMQETLLQANLDVSGGVNIGSEFNVLNESPAFLSGTLNVNGATVIDNIVEISGETRIENSAKIMEDLRIGNELVVSGITNLDNTLNVNNQTATNLSGQLNVDGISNLNNSLNVQGVSTLEEELNVNGVTSLNNNVNIQGESNLAGNFNVNNTAVSNLSGALNVGGLTTLSNNMDVTGTSTFNDEVTVNSDLIVENKIETAELYVSSDQDNDYVAVFENTSGSQDADGIAIKIETNTLSIDNHFVSFYGNNNYLAGRIESYDLAGGDLLESFPVPDIETLFNVFDFSQVLEWTPPSYTFNEGSLPSASFNSGALPSASFSRGSLPSINFAAVSFSAGSLPSLSFNAGSLPSLGFNAGSLPTASFDIGTLNLNFDGFYNPELGSEAASQLAAIAAWGAANGSPGYQPITPLQKAAIPLVLVANQFARNQGVVYGSKGADYAEWLEKENPEDKFTFGEVVGVRGGKISRNTQDADHVMTISYNPIVLGNMPDKGRETQYEKVGFMGQVPALVAGKVAIGDFIIASGNNDGYAISVAPKDITLSNLKNIIGRAWSESDPTGLSLINVSVGLKTNEWIVIFEKQEEKMKDLQTQLNELNKLSKTVKALELKLEQLGLN